MRAIQVFFLLVLIVLLPEVVRAAEPGLPIIVHEAPLLQELPDPGAPLKLQLKLQNVDRVGLSVRAYIVRDGSLMDTSITKTEVDEAEEVLYTLEIPSPLAELSYQLAAFQNGKLLVTSKQFDVRRTCIPRVELTQVDPKAGSEAEVRIKALFEQARGLENDIKSYDRALKLIEEMQKQMQ